MRQEPSEDDRDELKKYDNDQNAADGPTEGIEVINQSSGAAGERVGGIEGVVNGAGAARGRQL